MEITKVRDLTLIKIDRDKTMVIACDSCGSIGMKTGDVLKVPPFYTGKYTARVALMEVLCTGAQVITVVDAICNEMDNTGLEIIKGIKEELKASGIKDIVLTGSTEENFETVSTGLGITVVGIAENKILKVNKVKAKAIVVSIGLPKMGDEIKLDSDEEIVQYNTIAILLKTPGVYEIVPVGSKGIYNEVCQLAESNRMKFEIEKNVSIDVNKSAGPSTVVIAAISEKALELIKQIKNINIIGRLNKE